MSAYRFHKHELNPLGERLRQARLDRGISFKKASKDLNIATKYLEALEFNQPKLMPGKEYFDRYLKKYSEYLALDSMEMEKLRQKADEFNQSQFIKKQNSRAWSEYLSRILIAVAIIGLVSFLIFKVNDIFQPPPLSIISPADGQIVTDRQLLVSGMSSPEAEIVINNKAVYVEQSGKFTTTVDLQKGLNLITMTAKKRYSRTTTAEIRVLLKD